jgi:hypothetical protein
MEIEETKEKLVIKKLELSDKQKLDLQHYNNLAPKVALISRYPLEADKQWIEANEREALDWDFKEQNGRIELYYMRLLSFHKI